MSESKAAVKRVEAPLVQPEIQPEIQLELTKRSAYGLATAAVAMAILIFISGLVVGVSVNLDRADRADALATVEKSPVTVEQPVIAMATVPEVLPDTTVPYPGSALPLTGFDSLGLAPDAPRPELGALLTAPTPAASTPARSSVSAPQPKAASRPATASAGSGAAAAAGTFHLQVGAFRAPENADNLKARLVERGYTVRVRVTEGSAGQPLFRVLLGEYPTEATARSAAAEFESEMGQEAYVMTSRELGS